MKTIGWLIGIVLLLIVGLGVYLVMNTGDLIKTAVETLGPEYLGVDVSLGSADISLTEGSGELRGLVIGNPEGFDGPYAFSLSRIKLALDPLEQSQELITLKAIEIDAADLAMIAKGQNTNLQAILASLESEPTSEPVEESGAPAPKIIIESFSFTNARTSMDSDILGEAKVEIADIHLSGIGQKSHGVTIRDAVDQMLRPIVLASTEALARESLDELQGQAEEKVDKELQERLGTDLDGLKDRFRN